MIEATDRRYTVDEYFGLVSTGVLHPDDRVELLEGVIVAMAPQNPAHASALGRVSEALRSVVGTGAVLRVQSPLLVGQWSATEPDVAVVPGRFGDYDRKHPTSALLVVEIAYTSLPQDRLTKARTYAAAGIPEYWIVNLRDDCVEVHTGPDVTRAVYAGHRVAGRGELLAVTAFPDVPVAVDDLLPDEFPGGA